MQVVWSTTGTHHDREGVRDDRCLCREIRSEVALGDVLSARNRRDEPRRLVCVLATRLERAPPLGVGRNPVTANRSDRGLFRARLSRLDLRRLRLILELRPLRFLRPPEVERDDQQRADQRKQQCLGKRYFLVLRASCPNVRDHGTHILGRGGCLIRPEAAPLRLRDGPTDATISHSVPQLSSCGWSQ